MEIVIAMVAVRKGSESCSGICYRGGSSRQCLRVRGDSVCMAITRSGGKLSMCRGPVSLLCVSRQSMGIGQMRGWGFRDDAVTQYAATHIPRPRQGILSILPPQYSSSRNSGTHSNRIGERGVVGACVVQLVEEPLMFHGPKSVYQRISYRLVVVVEESIALLQQRGLWQEA